MVKKTGLGLFKSKTVWGFGLAIVVAGLQAMGLLDPSLVSELVKYASGILGIFGVREALN